MLTIESCPKELKCPVCGTIYKGEIFQCEKGHNICFDCLITVKLCRECCFPMPAIKIRNYDYENFLDKIVFSCQYKSVGCTVETSRKDVSSHVNSCKYRPKAIKFCKRIGLACDYDLDECNIKMALDHFKTAHCFGHYNVSDLRVYFGLQSICVDLTHRLSPIMIHSGDDSQPLFIILCKRDKESIYFQYLEMTGSYSPSKNILIETIIKSTNEDQNPDISYTTSPIHIKFVKASQSVVEARFRCNIEYLKTHYSKKSKFLQNELEISFRLKGDVSQNFQTKCTDRILWLPVTPKHASPCVATSAPTDSSGVNLHIGNGSLFNFGSTKLPSFSLDKTSSGFLDVDGEKSQFAFGRAPKVSSTTSPLQSTSVEAITSKSKTLPQFTTSSHSYKTQCRNVDSDFGTNVPVASDSGSSISNLTLDLPEKQLHSDPVNTVADQMSTCCSIKALPPAKTEGENGKHGNGI